LNVVHSDDKHAGQASRNTLPKYARLTRPIEFKRVFTKPAVCADECFKVLARRNNANRPRLGMAVSRQVDRRAVGRNRIKRLIRESFRQRFADGGPAVDFVVLPRHASATISNRRLRLSLDRLWTRTMARLAETPQQPGAEQEKKSATLRP